MPCGAFWLLLLKPGSDMIVLLDGAFEGFKIHGADGPGLIDTE
jgi:hypothetical protein